MTGHVHAHGRMSLEGPLDSGPSDSVARARSDMYGRNNPGTEDERFPTNRGTIMKDYIVRITHQQTSEVVIKAENAAAAKAQALKRVKAKRK